MQQLTPETFDNAVKSGVIVLDFWADWCAPCKIYAPIFEKVTKAFEGKATFYKVNAEENSVATAQKGVNALPTTLILKDGVEVAKLVGLVTAATLTAKLEEVLK